MKKDYLSPYKLEKMQKTLEEGKQYYPTDNSGIIDEWGALARHQDALWNAYQKQEKVKKKMDQSAYYKELEAQRDMRRTKAEREAAQRLADERAQNEIANQYNSKYNAI